MRCPIHKDVWLYEGMMEKEGFCPECNKSYDITKDPNNMWYKEAEKNGR